MTLLEVRDLSIVSRMADGEHTIVRGIDLAVGAGETLGIVGESGSGKSMTARAIAGLLPTGLHARGEVRYAGRQVLGRSERELQRMRGSGIALILQDPFTMLNPLMRCGDQIGELLVDAHGRRLSRRARRAEAVRRLREVGIDDADVAGAYPFELSGGMRQRVGIAAAIARDPDVLIADEPSTALDVTTQREVLASLRRLQESRGLGLVLITHDLRLAFSMCDRIAVLYAGSLIELAPASALEAEPGHPYSLGLLLSEPPGDRRVQGLRTIGGSVPDPDAVSGMCPFAPRCRWCEPICTAESPPLAPLGPDRLSACVRQPEIAPELLVARADATRAATAPPRRGEYAALVEIAAIEKRFGAAHGHGRGRVVEALRAVSLEVAAGESVGLVGESGSGKTTLARCLVGLERPDAGRIAIDGIDASDFSRLSGRDRDRVRRTVQMVFQDPYSTLNPARTIGATLREALTVRDPRARHIRRRVRDLLEAVGLTEAHAARKPVALSGGERQRVAVARALAADPRLIVCDEPVSSLDVSVQAQILELLGALHRDRGVGCLFITHDLAVARQVVDRVYVLRRGEVVESGPVDDVLDRPSHPYTRALIDSIPRGERSGLG